MKKRKKQLASRVGPVCLDINDIQEIYEILMEIAGDKQVTIVTDDYEVTDPSGLAKINNDRTTDLNISCLFMLKDGWESFDLSFRRRYANLRTTSDQHEFAGAAHKIGQILKEKQLSRWVRLTNYWPNVAMPLLLVPLVIFFFTIGSGNGQVAFVALAGLILIIVSLIIHYLTRSTRESRILLVSRNDAPSFWERKRDDILINVLTFMLGVIGTLIAQSLGKLWFP